MGITTNNIPSTIEGSAINCMIANLPKAIVLTCAVAVHLYASTWIAKTAGITPAAECIRITP